MEDKKSAKEVLEQKQMKRYFRSIKRIERTKGTKPGSNGVRNDIKQMVLKNASSIDVVEVKAKKEKKRKVKTNEARVRMNNNNNRIDISTQHNEEASDSTETAFAQNTFWRDPLPDLTEVDFKDSPKEVSNKEIENKECDQFNQSTFWKDPLPEIEIPNLAVVSFPTSNHQTTTEMVLKTTESILVNKIKVKQDTIKKNDNLQGKSKHAKKHNRNEDEKNKLFYVEEKEELNDSVEDLEGDKKSTKDLLLNLTSHIRSLEKRISVLEVSTKSSSSMSTLVVDEGIGSDEC